MRNYMIETRDRKCVLGTITRINADSLTAKVYSSNPISSQDTIAFPRDDVFRVAVGLHTYYSGRSSWSDVSSLRVQGREHLKIVTKSGKTYEAKPPFTVSEDRILFDPSGKSTKLLKSEVAQIYDIVVKPLTDRGEYAAEELGPFIIFDPDFYVYGLHLEQYVPVLLYDAGKPEDNSPAQCEREK